MPDTMLHNTASSYALGAEITLDNGAEPDFSVITKTSVDSTIVQGGPLLTSNTSYLFNLAGGLDRTDILQDNSFPRASLNSVGFLFQAARRPTNAQQIFKFTSGSGATTRIGIGLDQVGRLLVVNAAGSSSGRVSPSGPTDAELQAGIYITFWFSMGTGTTDRCDLAVYDSTGTFRPEWSPPIIDSNFSTTTTAAAINFGKTTTTDATTWEWLKFSDIRVNSQVGEHFPFPTAAPEPNVADVTGTWQQTGTVSSKRVTKATVTGSWAPTASITTRKTSKASITASHTQAATVSTKRNPRATVTGNWQQAAGVFSRVRRSAGIVAAHTHTGDTVARAVRGAQVGGAHSWSAATSGTSVHKAAVAGTWSFTPSMETFAGEVGINRANITGNWTFTPSVSSSMVHDASTFGVITWAGTTSTRKRARATLSGGGWTRSAILVTHKPTVDAKDASIIGRWNMRATPVTRTPRRAIIATEQEWNGRVSTTARRIAAIVSGWSFLPEIIAIPRPRDEITVRAYGPFGQNVTASGPRRKRVEASGPRG